jgi:Mg2+ and Co2+ transporter CorA
MDVRAVRPDGVERCDAGDIKALLQQPETIVWVDIPTVDAEATHLLSEVFGFHPLAVHDCAHRNSLPKCHIYPTAVQIVLHAPEPGQGGHVHYVELDQLIGPGVLVTAHGPLNPNLDPQVALVETTTVARRLEAGRLHPASSFELSSAIVTALANRMRDYLNAQTGDISQLEHQVTGGQHGKAEDLLDRMFRVRHGVQTVKSMTVLSGGLYGRMVAIKAFGDDGQRLLADHVDQFNGIGILAEGVKDYLQGVIEFFQTQTNTKMMIAGERLAVIAAVTLPITALSSVMGMNVIANDRSDPVLLTILLVIMLLMSVVLLVWAKRRGWW